MKTPLRAEISNIIIKKMILRQVEYDRKGVGFIAEVKSKEDLAIEAADEIIEVIKKEFRPDV